MGATICCPSGRPSWPPHTTLRQVEQEKASAVRREAIEKSESEMLAQQLAEVSLQFTRKVGEQEVLYGSVTSLDIAESLKEKGFEIDRRKIDLGGAPEVPGQA